jgi:hypothetical protein
MMNKGHLPREYVGLRYANPTYMANKASLWIPIFTLKEKTLKPDVEAIPMLNCQQGPVFIEFQGYSDSFIRFNQLSIINYQLSRFPIE